MSIKTQATLRLGKYTNQIPGGARIFREGNILRKPIIAGNWKMNMTNTEAARLIAEIIPAVKDAEAEVVICPNFTCLATAVELTKGTGIGVGAQNVHWEPKGAFTGETSIGMLLDLGVKYVIIGHSERRQYFAETDETVNRKVLAALNAGLIPIVCVGESLEQREAGKAAAVVSGQTGAALKGVDPAAAEKVVVAYEPIWAIGTGKTATAQDANEVNTVIRETLAKLFGAAIADKIRIQYGGSMNAKNASELMAQSNIDGGLIGGAALKAEDFARIVFFDK